MTITIDLTPEMKRELQDALTAAMLADLRSRTVPQLLDELKPRCQLEPGQTLADVLAAHPWPGDQTDEELQAALKAMG